MTARATCAAIALATMTCFAGTARAQTPTDIDAPEVASQYDAAFDALVRGDFEAAIAGFDAVAANSVASGRRAAAIELARLARAMHSREVAAAPGAPGAPDKRPHVGSDDEEERDGRSGRTELVIATTAASVYAGVVFMDLLDQEELRNGTLIITGTTAAGFLASFYGSRGRHITNGMADSFSAGLALGATTGFLLVDPLNLDTSEEALGFVLGTMAVGGAGALWLADEFRPSRAQPTFAVNLAYAGVATVGLGLAAVQPDIDGDTAMMLLAGGLDAGALAGVLLAPELDWSHARARYVGLGSFLGALGGLALGVVITGTPSDDDDDGGRIVAGTTLAGLWAGFGTTVHLTRGMSPDRSRVARTANETVVVPTMIGGGAGLGIAGTF